MGRCLVNVSAIDLDPKPWWYKSGPVAAVTTLLITVLGAVVSATTAFVGDLEKKREIELETDKQVHDLRLAYLDRLDKGALARKQVLQFMTMSGYDPELKAWAVEELKKVELEVEALQKDLKTKESGERQAGSLVAELDKQVHETPKRPTSSAKSGDAKSGDAKSGPKSGPVAPPAQTPPAKVIEDYEHAQADLEAKQADVDRTKAALGLVPVPPNRQMSLPPQTKLPSNLLNTRRFRTFIGE